MYRWGELLGRRAGALVLTAITVLLAAGFFGASVFGHLSNGGFDDPDSQSAQVAQIVRTDFTTTTTDVMVVYSDPTRTVDDPSFQKAVTGTIAGLDPHAVAATTTWFQTGAPGLVSADRHSTLVLVRLAGADDKTKLDGFTAISDQLVAPGLTTQVGGTYAVFTNVNEQVGKDIARAEAISMPIVFLLSLVIFGSLAAALMPTLVGGVAVVGAFAIVRAITGVTDVSVFVINVITLLGMGLAIDYTLFIVNRYRDELARVAPAGGRLSRAERGQAMARTMATAGRTVLFSGVIVAASLSSLLLFPQVFLRSMGFGGMAAVLVAMVAALTVLPAVLVLLGHRLEWGTMPWRRRALRAGAQSSESRVWARVAAGVMRRPVVALVAIVAVLVLLGSPFLRATWGGVDDQVLPASASARAANDVIAERFGGETTTAAVVLRGASEAGVQTWVQQASQLTGVTSAKVVGVQGDTMLVHVTWAGTSQTTASQDTAKALRGLHPTGSGEVLVGGPSAATVDLVASVGDGLPRMAGLVALVMFVLLFIAFGSIVLPLKAIVMNALSIGASFGIVTLIFAEGHLEGLLQFTSPGYLDVTQPILMLAIVFGLSMDYEVFLLSRVREEWDAGADNAAAVVKGVSATGGIITAAAVLLATVIGGFATSGIIIIKMLGVGMLVAVLMDATVVRGLLVPATMRLLGAANWWAPGPLRRWWERHGHRERTLPEVDEATTATTGPAALTPA